MTLNTIIKHLVVVVFLALQLQLAIALECYQCKVDASMCTEDIDLEAIDCDFVTYKQNWPGIEISTTVYNYNSSYTVEKAPYPFVKFAKGCLSIKYDDGAVLKSCMRYDVALKDKLCEYIATTTTYANCHFCDTKRCNGSSGIRAFAVYVTAVIINCVLQIKYI